MLLSASGLACRLCLLRAVHPIRPLLSICTSTFRFSVTSTDRFQTCRTEQRYGFGSMRGKSYESFSSLLRLHGPFEQLRLRGELRFGIIFGSDKNVEILIGDGVLEFTFEFVVHLQHASILGVLPPSLNPYHVGLPRRS